MVRLRASTVVRLSLLLCDWLRALLIVLGARLLLPRLLLLLLLWTCGCLHQRLG